MDKIISKYDEFGVLRSIPWEDIKKGDLVEYLDTKKEPGNNGKIGRAHV